MGDIDEYRRIVGEICDSAEKMKATCDDENKWTAEPGTPGFNTMSTGAYCLKLAWDIWQRVHAAQTPYGQIPLPTMPFQR